MDFSIERLHYRIALFLFVFAHSHVTLVNSHCKMHLHELTHVKNTPT